MYIYWFSSDSSYRRRRWRQCRTPQYNHYGDILLMNDKYHHYQSTSLHSIIISIRVGITVWKSNNAIFNSTVKIIIGDHCHICHWLSDCNLPSNSADIVLSWKHLAMQMVGDYMATGQQNSTNMLSIINSSIITTVIRVTRPTRSVTLNYDLSKIPIVHF